MVLLTEYFRSYLEVFIFLGRYERTNIINNHPVRKKSEMEQEELEWIKQDRDKLEGILPKVIEEFARLCE